MSVLERLYPQEIEAYISGKPSLELARDNPQTGFARTQQFIMAALESGAQLDAQRHIPRVNGSTWLRNLELTRRYMFTEDVLGIIGEDIGVTREAIRQIIVRTVRRLWEQSPEEVQQVFSLQETTLRKPPTLQSAMRQSRSLGGASIEIARMVDEGKSWEEMRDAAGGSGKLAVKRRTLNRWGIEVPRKLRDLKRIASQVADTGDMHGVDHDFYNRYGRGKKSLIITVTRVARGAGLHFRNDRHTSLIVEVLEDAGITVRPLLDAVKSGPQKGERSYFVIPRAQEQQAHQILQTDLRLEGFKRNPVRKIFGPDSDKMPTTTDLMRKKGYESLFVLLRKRGVKIRRGFPLEDICGNQDQFTIYGFGNHVFCQVEQQEALAEFIKGRLADIRTSKENPGSR